jgi:hypothetical protein
MRRALSVIGRAFQLWWRDFALLIGLNLAWLALQVPVFTGPPATAAAYVVARRLAREETVTPRDAWQALRSFTRPAWRWGALNLLFAAAVLVNFIAYREYTGGLWTALRIVWGVAALLWFGVNLFYWPFWLAQEDRRMATTLRNALLVYLKSPGFGLTLLLACAALIVISVLVTIPLAVGLMMWLALIGTLAVEAELKPGRNREAPATLENA